MDKKPSPDEKEINQIIDLLPDADDKFKYYLKHRLYNQQKWYEKKATHYKKIFMRNQKAVIWMSAIIPVQVSLFTVLGINPIYSGIFSAVVSAAMGIIAALDKLKDPHTTWYNYRASEESLKKELYMCIYEVGAYEGLTPERRRKELVQRVESLISTDIARFVQNQQNQEAQLPTSNQDGSSATASLEETNKTTEVNTNTETNSDPEEPSST